MPINPSNFKPVYNYVRQLYSVSERTWLEVAKLLEERKFKKHEFFAKSGRREHHSGIVLSGVFRSFIHTSGANEFTRTIYTPINYKTPISYLGAYTSLITGNINQINIEALTDATVLMCPYERINSLSKNNPKLAKWLVELANLFFMGKEKREIQLSTMTAEQRYTQFRHDFPELENQINQYYIAQFIGVTPTQLSRIRKKVFQRA